MSNQDTNERSVFKIGSNAETKFFPVPDDSSSAEYRGLYYALIDSIDNSNKYIDLIISLKADIEKLTANLERAKNFIKNQCDCSCIGETCKFCEFDKETV